MRSHPTLSIAATLGTAVPLLIVAVSGFLWQMGVRLSPHANYLASVFKIMVWPSSFPLMALTENNRWYTFEYLALLTLAIVENVLLYCALGFLISLGIRKFHPLTYLVGALIAGYWIFVLRA